MRDEGPVTAWYEESDIGQASDGAQMHMDPFNTAIIGMDVAKIHSASYQD